jgi:ADP-heptose:LPS heptosyltransferase
MEFREILLIHLGGLGDYCLSESVFHSVARHFNEPLVGLGTRRFLDLFEGYFDRVHGIESARWLYLFSSRPADITWERIVFIGKDREGSLRERWQRFSRSPLLFVDMYPQGAFDAPTASGETRREGRALPHVEDYQMAQLPRFGIEAVRKEISLKPCSRVLLYPEKGFRKEKWPPRNFLDLYLILKAEALDVHVIESPDLPLDLPDKVVLGELSDVRRFFDEGGIFVSNDSGMAHLAGMCGLFTVTVFTDFDPRVWHPRGAYAALKRGEDRVDVETLGEIILAALGRIRRGNGP